ncbi:MAG TPA: VWA domain-containing protein [bacterium]|nr:VWA domain-containing protein [bacterium]
MFNFLHKKESISPSDEKDPEKKDTIEQPSSTEPILIDNDNNKEKASSFNPDSLEKLREAVEIQEEMGNHLSLEDTLLVTGTSPEKLPEILAEQDINLEAKGEQVIPEIARVLESLEEDKKSESSGFRRFTNYNSIKAAFIALMLLVKFAPDAQGAEPQDKLKEGVKMGKEVKGELDREPNPDKTYQLSAKDFDDERPEKHKSNDAKPLDIKLEENSRLASLELTHYFATDKADIINPQAIISDFEAFLSKITPDNAQEIMAADFKLFGSSDERPTSNWKGSNTELTKARLTALDKLLTETLQNYKFDKLPADLAEQIRNKKFFHEMPFSQTGPEEGVIYITDLDNPETGQKYTPEEVASIKANYPEKYKLLLDDCRRISFSATMPQMDFINKMKMRNSEVEKGYEVSPRSPEFLKMNEYDNVYLLFDNSPSVGDSYPYMAQMIEKQNFKELKVNFATFSNHLDGIKQLDNSVEVAKNIRDTKYFGDTRERALDVAYTALNKMKAEEKNALFIMTDEDIQAVSWEKIQKARSLAAEKNACVYFYYGDDKHQAIRQVSLDELERAYKEQAMAAIAPKINFLYNAASKRISALESRRQSQENLISRLAAKTNIPAYQKSLLAHQKELSKINENLTNEKEKLAALMRAWEGGDIEDVFVQQAFYWKVASDAEVQKVRQGIEINVAVNNLGSEVVDLASLSEADGR